MDKTVAAGRVKGTLTPPCSKSYAQRALAAALLAEGTTTLRNIGFCDDTRSALRCIEALGARVRRGVAGEGGTVEGCGGRSGAEADCAAGGTGGATILIDGAVSSQGGLKACGGVLQVGESGLAARLFTPIASLCTNAVIIRGEGTLLDRPMGAMGAALRQLGVKVQGCTLCGLEECSREVCSRDGDYLPMHVHGPVRGGRAIIDGSVSSQLVTGLLMALPLAPHDTTLTVESAVSTPYIDMTLDMARRFGVEILQRGYTEFYIPGAQRYRPADITIESDWSAAAFMLVAGATAGEVCICGLSTLSKQADRAICDALVRAGAEVVYEHDTVKTSQRPLHGFEFDATDCPDLFPALAALASAVEGVSVLRGVSRLRHKESNRAEAIFSEFRRLGIEVSLTDDEMRIVGGRIRAASVDSHRDHRIAMALAVAALRCEGEQEAAGGCQGGDATGGAGAAGGAVTITGAECVSKSYPDFFADLEKIRI